MNLTTSLHGFSLDEVIDRRVVPALKTHAMVLGNDVDGLFPAGVADMDFKAPPVVLEALEKRFEHGVFGYEAMPDALLPALTGWMARRHGWEVGEGDVLRAPNVLNSLAIAASLFTDPGDGVIVQPPVFFDFYDVIRENGRNVVANPLRLAKRHYSMDFQGLEQVASDPANRMLFLCNPHNPVGRVWTRAELKQLGDICAEHDVLVVSDEIHGDIIFPGHDFTPFAALGSVYADNCITCTSPAKSFNMAACCSAFTIISNDSRRQAFQVENSRLTVNKNNAFASAAMVAAYSDGESWLDEVITYLQSNLSLVRDRLADVSAVDLIEPEGTFLVWLDFRKLSLSPDELTAFLRTRARWAITRGQSFGVEGEGFGRLNIACPRSQLDIALDQLINAVSQYTDQS